MPKDVILTPQGLEKLKAELEDLTTTKRREVAERIKDAREYGDISENSEYDDAKNEQAMLEGKILVQVGSAVTIKPEKGKSETYTIVGSAESDPKQRKLSNESPVGRALIGKGKGEKVTVALPNGQSRTLTVEKIEVAG